MNVHTPISITRQLHEAHKARQRRFADAARRHQQRAAAEAEEARAARAATDDVPLWQRFELHFKDHVNRWRGAMAKPAKCRFKALIKQRCEEWGVRREILESTARSAYVSAIRFDLYLELTEMENPPSLMRIGSMFGNRDHSTVLNGVRRAIAARDAGTIGLHRDPARQAFILSVYDATGSILETIHKTGMNEVSLREFLWVKGREVTRTDASTMSNGTRTEIRKSYRGGLSREELMNRFSITSKTLHGIIHDLLPPPQSERSQTKASAKAEMMARRDAKALELYLAGMIYADIAERIGATEDVIVKLKRKHGWPDRKKPSPMKTADRDAMVRKMWHSGAKRADIAAAVGMSERWVDLTARANGWPKRADRVKA